MYVQAHIYAGKAEAWSWTMFSKWEPVEYTYTCTFFVLFVDVDSYFCVIKHPIRRSPTTQHISRSGRKGPKGEVCQASAPTIHRHKPAASLTQRVAHFELVTHDTYTHTHTRVATDAKMPRQCQWGIHICIYDGMYVCMNVRICICVRVQAKLEFVAWHG